MQPEEKKSHSTLVSAIVILILAVIGYGGYKYMKKDNSEVKPESLPPVSEPVGTMYKDGTYNAIGNYVSPGGAEEIDVTLTLKNDVITDVVVKSLATRPESKFNQGKFIGGINAEVVGKKLSEVNLTKVSGSSLTPQGWNDAISKIQVQAQA